MGGSVVVLKGGVAALSDRDAVDLVDVDVLARPDEARALAAALDAAGYRGDGPSSPLHLEGRIAEGGIRVEVHTSIDMAGCGWSERIWGRVTPLAGATRLRRLAARDHVWHLLVHAGVLHPYRRGVIRELVLLSQALTQCSEDDLAEVTAQVRRHPYARTLQDMLSMARGVAGAAPPEDRFGYQAAMSYVVRWSGRWLPLPEVIRDDVGRWTVALFSGRAEMRKEWERVRLVTLGPSASRSIAWIERRAPRLGRGVRVATRVLRVAIGIAFGLPLALGAAVVAARATRRGAKTA